jgi:DnaJ domain
LTINPLIPYLPAFLSFLIYGWITGGLFAFGRRGIHGCLFTIGFWYLYAVLVVFFGLLLTVQATINQLFFLAGVMLPYIFRRWDSEYFHMLITAILTVVDVLKKTFLFICSLQGKGSTKQGNGSPKKPNEDTKKRTDRDTSAHGSTDDAMRREQERREREARTKREQAEQAERDRQEKQKKASSPPPPDNTRDQRSPEEILGLKPPWTPAELKTAYQREAGRTHPDKWIGKPELIREAMEAEYKNIQEAYRRLKG